MAHGMRTVTWIDRACGCSESSDGWVIVTNTCDEHRELIVVDGLDPRFGRGWNKTTKTWTTRGTQFGPFKGSLR